MFKAPLGHEHESVGEQSQPAFLAETHSPQWSPEQQKSFQDWWDGSHLQSRPGLFQKAKSKALQSLRETGEALQRLTKLARLKPILRTSTAKKSRSYGAPLFVRVVLVFAAAKAVARGHTTLSQASSDLSNLFAAKNRSDV